MVQTIHLIRHGWHPLLKERLCGRMPGVGLDEFGRRQVALCAGTLARPPTGIRSSPQQRARESAEILALHFDVPLEIVAAVDEIDFGDWTGLSFAELSGNPEWQRWNRERSSSRPPNGETAHSLQERVVRYLEQLRKEERDADGTVVVVSHAETIRTALLHYSGRPLDDFLSIEVAPASVSTLWVDDAGIHIGRINQEVPA